jgi:hypothetical protein
MTLTALVLALAAFALFGLSTDAHHRRWFGGRVTAIGRKLFRIGAWTALVLAFAASIGARGWVFGPVLWFAVVMLAAGATFLFLNLASARYAR